ncbi:2-C-methyl-D-erythritol 4-phosphate cytidylyltransferase [Methylophaga sp.]|jgi:2-C-methyl-D-erythritol 4-phosphate cytidylyltransferase|uniref:2-C-methyl-D-erythritol 4-phosphate cytidylyltransferase n=1 Tax=Methylophaga sp. TaxID=2024840 RepID=UPI0014004F7D|nr:2-C-methyl-D-erythritol 4-phosphate cytidylyltransferase [Methylophaga sp.]MTI62315.1 2-C-methyl-D-erythritol 4-phosphate cytidylyltransferase [Methylophaga sp.]
MSKSDAVWAVVPAAGIGSRMGSDKPKQYLQLNNKPLLQHTLERLASHPRITGIVVALAENDPWWPQLDLELDCQLLTATGGESRSDSVFNALETLTAETDADPWLLVHDAARPCLRHSDIDRMLKQLGQHEVGGILGVPVTDTVKRVDSHQTIIETVDRHGLWRAATPQMFRLHLLKKALASAAEQGLAVTDEASAVELTGLKPMMVEGHQDNIKITLPQDLALASLYLQQQSRGQ